MSTSKFFLSSVCKFLPYLASSKILTLAQPVLQRAKATGNGPAVLPSLSSNQHKLPLHASQGIKQILLEHFCPSVQNSLSLCSRFTPEFNKPGQ